MGERGSLGSQRLKAGGSCSRLAWGVRGVRRASLLWGVRGAATAAGASWGAGRGGGTRSGAPSVPPPPAAAAANASIFEAGRGTALSSSSSSLGSRSPLSACRRGPSAAPRVTFRGCAVQLRYTPPPPALTPHRAPHDAPTRPGLLSGGGLHPRARRASEGRGRQGRAAGHRGPAPREPGEQWPGRRALLSPCRVLGGRAAWPPRLPSRAPARAKSRGAERRQVRRGPPARECPARGRAGGQVGALPASAARGQRGSGGRPAGRAARAGAAGRLRSRRCRRRCQHSRWSPAGASRGGGGREGAAPTRLASPRLASRGNVRQRLAVICWPRRRAPLERLRAGAAKSSPAMLLPRPLLARRPPAAPAAGRPRPGRAW